MNPVAADKSNISAPIQQPPLVQVSYNNNKKTLSSLSFVSSFGDDVMESHPRPVFEILAILLEKQILKKDNYCNYFIELLRRCDLVRKDASIL